jgi:hypothetical protein
MSNRIKDMGNDSKASVKETGLASGEGRVITEFPFRPSAEHEFWRPKVAFVRKERWQKGAGYFFGAPDLVIEVLSPSETKAEILDHRFSTSHRSSVADNGRPIRCSQLGRSRFISQEECGQPAESGPTLPFLVTLHSGRRTPP